MNRRSEPAKLPSKRGIKWCPLLILIGLLGAGCQKPAVPSGSLPSAPDVPQQAQPRLPTVRLWLGQEELIAEVARSAKELQTGMMFRTNMAENEAMLFVFAYPHQASFYMRNTRLPLSCAYLDDEGAIQEIHALHPFEEKPVVSASDNIRFVLETTAGWFERHQISTGAVVTTSRGPLLSVFFRQP